MTKRDRWTSENVAKLGTVLDRVLAAELGISSVSVCKQRKLRNIKALRVTAAKRSKVDPLIGTLPDVEIAKRLKVSAALVYRRRMALSEEQGELIESPRAARRLLTLKDAQAAASQRGGLCMASKAGGLMQWQCSEGHTFEATAHRVVRRRQWCGRCSGQVKE